MGRGVGDEAGAMSVGDDSGLLYLNFREPPLPTAKRYRMIREFIPHIRFLPVFGGMSQLFATLVVVN